MLSNSTSNAYPEVLVSINEHFSSSLPAHVRCHLLKLSSGALFLDLDRRLGNLVPKQPAGVSPPSQNQFRIRLLSINDSLLDILVDRRLNGAHEPRAHIDTLSTETQCSSETLAVGEPTRSNEWYAQRLS